MAGESGDKLMPLLHGTHQPTAPTSPVSRQAVAGSNLPIPAYQHGQTSRTSDPREPEAAAAEAALRATGCFVPVPPGPALPTAELGLEDRTAGITTLDTTASEVGAGNAPQQAERAGTLGAMRCDGGSIELAAQANAEDERETALHGAPLAAVAERPHPGSGSSRIGARPGATALVDPQTEAELMDLGLPRA